MGILEFLSSMQSGAKEAMAPVSNSLDGMRGSMAEFFGDTKTMIDEGGDGAEYTVIDKDAFNNRMDNFAKASAQIAKMPTPPSGAMRPQQVNSSPAPVMGAAPNPYAPVNYGTMQYGQQSGIGQEPTMEQILKALQSRGL